jgi:S-layer protein
MAAQDYVAVVQQLYVSYFGRPADYFGLQNFTAQLEAMKAPKTFAELNAVVQADKAGTTAVSKLVNSFNTAPESVTLYGTDNSPIGISKFLVTVFQNVIGRTPELGPGWDFWFNALSSGGLRRADAAMAITEGALSNTTPQGLLDKQTVLNKQAVATAFTAALDTPTKINAYSTTAAVLVATGLLKEVTATTDVAAYQSAVLTAVDTIVAGSIPSTNSVLTKLVDTVVGGNGNDTVTATIGNAAPADDTFNALDSIDGSAGVDTLSILDVAGGTALPGGVVIKNVENISFRSAGNLTFDESTFSTTGLNKVIVTQAAVVTLDVAATTAVDVSGATGAVDVDGGSNVTVATASSAVTIGANVAAKGAVTVTNAGQAAAAIAIDGGTSVSVTTKGVTTGTVDIGGTTLPTGAVAVASTGVAADGATTYAMGAINIDGGSKVTVVQSAASDMTAAATDTSAQTVTQSAITIGGGKAVEVSITQTAAQAAVNYVAAIAANKKTQVVTFGAMTAGQTLEIAGLTFTASKALTAAEVAATFASIASAGVQGKSVVANGIYSGTLTGFAAGAASGVTVTLTEATAGTNAAAIVVGGTAAAGTSVAIGSAASNAATDLVAGVLGIVGGAVTIDDAAAGKLTTVALNGTGAASVTSDKLTSLAISNTEQAVTVVNTAATTLALALDNVTGGATVDLGAIYATLNLAANAHDSEVALTAGGVKALNVSGTAQVDLSAATLGVLETVAVTGSAGVLLDASMASVKSVTTAGSTGSSEFLINATLATFTGGAGVDVVETSADASTKAVALGGGNDTLILMTGTTSSTSTLSGGDGSDTLEMAAADAATLSGNSTFEGKIEGFEKVQIDAVGANATVDLSNLDDISYVISNGVAAGTLSITKMAAAGTLEIIGNNAGTAIDVALTDATGSADVLNLVLKSSAGVTGGVVSAAGVETINLTVTDTSGSIQTSTLSLTDAALTKVVVTGNGALTLAGQALTPALALLDGSAMSGKLTASTNGTVAQTIKGGAAGDALTATGFNDKLEGGAGNDTLIGGNLTTLTGGAGNDTFNVATATTNVNSYSTITDLQANDIIKFGASATTFNASKVVLADTAVFQDYANAAIQATNTGAISWFQIGGNTYVIQNVNDGASFLNGTDIIVKITGAVDLSKASFSSTADTALFIG